MSRLANITQVELDKALLAYDANLLRDPEFITLTPSEAMRETCRNFYMLGYIQGTRDE